MKPLETHEGKTWQDMPGRDDQAKKMNFALFKRGKFNGTYKPMSPERRKLHAQYGRLSNGGAQIAADSDELIERLRVVQETSGLTWYAISGQIWEINCVGNREALYDVIRRGRAISERYGPAIRRWLEEQLTREGTLCRS